LFLSTAISPFTGATNVSLQNPAFFARNYESRLTAYSAELQQIWQGEKLGLIGGGRFQTATADTRDDLNRIPPLGAPNQVLGDNSTDLRRYSVYGYANYDLLDSLKLIAGVSYDRLDYPVNIDTRDGDNATKGHAHAFGESEVRAVDATKDRAGMTRRPSVPGVDL